MKKENKFINQPFTQIIVIEEFDFLGQVSAYHDTFMLLNTFRNGDPRNVQYYTSKKVSSYKNVRLATSADFEKYGRSEVGFFNDDTVHYEKDVLKFGTDIRLPEITDQNIVITKVLKDCIIYKHRNIFYIYHDNFYICEYHSESDYFAVKGSYLQKISDRNSKTFDVYSDNLKYVLKTLSKSL